MKKIFAYVSVLMITMSTLFAGCGSDSEKKEDSTSVENTEKESSTKTESDSITIGFSIGHTTEERWQREIEMAEKWCEEQGVEFIVQSADDDPSKQIEQCETMITNGVDAILCQAIDANTIASVCASAEKSGVVMIAYERPITDPNCDYYIAFNSAHSGEIMAQSCLDLVPKGNYVYLHGDASVSDTLIYKEGSDAVLQPHIDSGDVKIVADQYCDGWSADKALEHTENALTANHNDVDAIIAANDTTAGAVVQALAAQGLEGSIPVSGMDGDIAACQRIVEGTQAATAFKYLPALNTAALELACDAVRGETEAVEARINSSIDDGQGGQIPTCWIEPVCVTKDNIDEVVIASGYYTIDQVYANIPEDQRPKVEVTNTLDLDKWGWVSEYTPLAK